MIMTKVTLIKDYELNNAIINLSCYIKMLEKENIKCECIMLKDNYIKITLSQDDNILRIFCNTIDVVIEYLRGIIYTICDIKDKTLKIKGVSYNANN